MLYQFGGEVIRGEGYGRKLGFPTINISQDEFLQMEHRPIFGVYSGKVELEGDEYRAGIIVGPEDAEGLPKLEAHLLAYGGDAYGKIVKFLLLTYIRPYKNFTTEEELVKQIQKDLESC